MSFLTSFGSLCKDHTPFKTTLCFLKLTESVKTFKIVPDIAFCFNLNIRLFCQTLSNTLDTSKTTALNSRLSSKD